MPTTKTTPIDHAAMAASADRAAAKARTASNEGTARFMDKLARAHRTLAAEATK